ncbi:MAG: hypothetical protein DBX63_06585 [Clostridia bacterium]|nr:MAG: hypothetical protein DBX63_06585 [Clostridia bacterium]
MVGEWAGETTKSHITIIPVYDSATEADDEDLVVDEYIDCHFFITGDYTTAKAAARAALKSAGICVDEFRYIECTNKQHHFVLSVIGRA